MAQETSIISLVPEANQEGTTIQVDEKTRNVTYSSEEPSSERLVAQVGFNKKSGTLNFVRVNSDILSVSGFLTAAQFGKGIRGVKGKTGAAGKDGREGRPGKDGKIGCQGPTGAKGVTGTSGLDGEDGEVGITGYAGAPGEQGERGDQGETGLPGHQGPIGAAGPSCIVGETGIQGPAPREEVHYGTDVPESDYFIWAIPYTEGQTTNPVPEAENMSGQVNDQYSTLSLVTDDTYGGSLVLSLVNFAGGTGPFAYSWTDSNDEFSDPSITVGNTGTTGSSLELKCLETIDKGSSVSITGKVNLTVRDSSTGKTLYIPDIEFVFNGANNQQDTGSDSGSDVVVGGGGGGCLVLDTPIHLYDGQEHSVGDIQVGDYLIGYQVDGMPDESQEGWQEWTTTSTRGRKVSVVVRNALRSWMSSYYRINDDIGITHGHEMFVKKNQTWGWHTADKLEVGDFFLNIDLEEVELVSITHVKEKTKVVVLDVEDVDTYFAGKSKILLHNAATTHKN